MTEHPSPTSEEVTNPLRQAETTLAHTRGNAGQLTIITQMNMGAAISVYLPANRDARFDAVSFIGMMVQVLAPLILMTTFTKVARSGFGIRWDVYMAVWALCWDISILLPTAAVRVPLATMVVVTSFVGALVGTHR